MMVASGQPGQKGEQIEHNYVPFIACMKNSVYEESRRLAEKKMLLFDISQENKAGLKHCCAWGELYL